MGEMEDLKGDGVRDGGFEGQTYNIPLFVCLTYEVPLFDVT